MEDIQTQLDQCKLLLDRAEVGLWEADFVQRGYICSDYLMSIFGKKGNNLSFFEFYYIIREDFRDLITTDFLSIQSVDTYEQIFPIITPTGEKWVRSRLCERKLNNGVCVKALGILQILPNFKLKEDQSISMSFKSFVDIYLTDLEPRIKRNTFLTKKHIIETKILPYFGKRKLDDIRTSDIIQWQNEIMKLKKDNGELFSPTYLKTIHNQLIVTDE